MSPSGTIVLPSWPGIRRRLGASERWSQNASVTGDSDVECQMMSAELQHPGISFRGSTEDRDVVEVPAEDRTVAERSTGGPIGTRRRTVRACGSLPGILGIGRRSAGASPGWSLVGEFIYLIALHDLLYLLQASKAEHGSEDVHCGFALYGRHLFDADAATRHHHRREVGPACPLLFIVKGITNALTLAAVEQRQEVIHGAHGRSGSCRRLSNRSQWGRKKKCSGDTEKLSHWAAVSAVP